MLNEAERMYAKETGGLLMGYKVGDDTYITEIVGPGPKAKHEKSGFTPDDSFQEKEMARFFYSTEGKVSYLGDWHTHPNSSAHLSELDKQTLREISFYEPSQIREPLMMVIGLSPFELRVWEYRRKRRLGRSQYAELMVGLCFDKDKFHH